MKSKLPLYVGIGASVVFAVLRVVQLLCMNSNGAASPLFLTGILYLLLAGMVVYLLAFFRKTAFTADSRNIPGRLTDDLMLFFGVSLLCEVWFLYSEGIHNRPLNIAGFSAVLAGFLYVAAFILRAGRRQEAAKWLTALGTLCLLAHFIAYTVYLFTNNRSSLSLTLNGLTVILFCGQLFFFKARIRETLGCGTPSSRVSLVRSSLFLLFLIPGEVIGQVLLRSSRFSSLAVTPLRGHPMELITDLLMLLLVFATLLSFLEPSASQESPVTEETVDTEVSPLSEDK